MADASPFAPTEEWKLGDFEIEEILGEGGSGTVYAATFHGARVALKVLRSDAGLSDRERKRFLDEAGRMRRVDHVGLVPMLGEGVLEDGRPYICMPRLEGETLAKRLARGRMPIPEALAAFGVLADAVSALHAIGLIHRDIKPENVFLAIPKGASDDPNASPAGASLRPVLLDLGIARDLMDEDSTTTVAGQVRGTPAYMAPERFFGSPASVRSDIYELAVMLYMMLVGQRPWDGTNDPSARLSPTPPRDLGVELPAALVTLLMRALSTRPEVRPSSARDFAVAVQRAAAAEPLNERTTTATIVATSAATAASAPVPARTPPSRSVWVWAVPLTFFGALGVATLLRGTRPPAVLGTAVAPVTAAKGSSVAHAGTERPVAAAPPGAPEAENGPPSVMPATATPAAATAPSPETPGGKAPRVGTTAASAALRPGAGTAVTPRTAARAAPAPVASSDAGGVDRYYLDRK